MYDKKDPRSTLASSASAKPKTGLIAEEQLGLFYQEEPQINDETGKTWFLRGHNFVLAYSELNPGGFLTREGQVDEYVALMPDAPSVLTAGDDREDLAGGTNAIWPPASSSRSSPAVRTEGASGISATYSSTWPSRVRQPPGLSSE